MSRASFSTCSTSRLDTSGIDRYSDKDFNELHTYEINDSTNVTPYKKQLFEKENNYLTANLSSSIEKWENIPKSTLNEYDGDGRLIDDNSELLGCRKDEHSSEHSSAGSGGDEVEQGRENVIQYDTVNDNKTSNNTSNNNANYDKINDDNDNYISDEKDKNGIYDCKNNNDNNINENNGVKSLMNKNKNMLENNIILTDFTANGIIRPVYINESDNIVNIDSIDTKMKIDGIIIGDYYDSKDDHDNYSNRNDNDNNDSNNIENNCNKNTHNYGNSNHTNNKINDDDNVNDNKSDINDDDDENGWTSMPSSHDLTTTLETIIQKENKENNENNENTTSKVTKEKKTEKIRSKKKSTQCSIENENEKNRSIKIMKNINIDEHTYDLYSDGTHSKILAYRFERVLLVETFKENAGNYDYFFFMFFSQLKKNHVHF